MELLASLLNYLPNHKGDYVVIFINVGYTIIINAAKRFNPFLTVLDFTSKIIRATRLFNTMYQTVKLH